MSFALDIPFFLRESSPIYLHDSFSNFIQVPVQMSPFVEVFFDHSILNGIIHNCIFMHWLISFFIAPLADIKLFIH